MYRVIGVISALLIFVIGILWLMIDGRSKDIEQLNRFAAAGNSQAPRMVDAATRLDSVSVEFPAVVFHYTILVPIDQIDVDELKEINERWFRTQACTNQEVLKKVLEPGYKIVRSYQDVSESHVLRMSFGNEFCNENT